MEYKQFKIWADTEDELDALLMKLENDGYRWYDRKDGLTNWKPLCRFRVCIFARSDGNITYDYDYDYFKKHRFKEVGLYEYLNEPAFDIPDFENQFIDMICGM